MGRILFSSLIMVFAFRPDVPGSNPVLIYISAMHLHICFFVTDFVRKDGGSSGIGQRAINPI